MVIGGNPSVEVMSQGQPSVIQSAGGVMFAYNESGIRFWYGQDDLSGDLQPFALIVTVWRTGMYSFSIKLER